MSITYREGDALVGGGMDGQTAERLIDKYNEARLDEYGSSVPVFERSAPFIETLFSE